MRDVDYLTPNETEAGMLTGLSVCDIPSAAKAGRALLGLGVRNVIVTMGRRGCLLVNRDGTCHVRALKVSAVDTTGAGDAFNGAFAVAMARRQSAADAMAFAASVAAFSVTRMGAQTSMPSSRELNAFLAKGH